ncbi:MAG: hypothetical protein WC144_00135 [Sulfurimonas sp.]|jgi:hypothetical protein|nr:hypothetical protein [Sulfurimonadaceae bacterium]
MSRSELYETIEFNEGFFQRHLGISFVKFLFLVVVVVGFGIYMGLLLYGKNSLEVLLNLRDYEVHLQQDISELKVQNAQLQKDYFELKMISPK